LLATTNTTNHIAMKTIMDYDLQVYIDNGYSSREEYLDMLREEYGKNLVNTLLTVLPPSEDFDGLVTTLEDMFDNEMIF
jgi:hypothetical protein